MLSMILACDRPIHKMYHFDRSNGEKYAVGKARDTWAGMWAIYECEPERISYRRRSDRGIQPRFDSLGRNDAMFRVMAPEELGLPFFSVKKEAYINTA